MLKWVKNNLFRFSSSNKRKVILLEKALSTTYPLRHKHEIAYQIGCQYEGQHISVHRQAVEFHLQEKAWGEAKEILLNIIDIIDELSHFYLAPPAPWYYIQLSNIFHYEEDVKSEIKFLKRYIDIACKYGDPEDSLLARYERLFRKKATSLEGWEWRQQFQAGQDFKF